MNTAAIVLAAGAGTRMKSKKPKVAHEILGKPLVRWVVDAAREAGADRIVSVVGHAREIVEPLVSDTEVVVQKAQRGTADAVLTCKEALAGFDGSLLVLSGDCPLITPDTIRELADMRARSNAAVVVLTMELDDPFGYGRIIRDGEGRVERIVEQKDANAAEVAVTECNSGFYCFDAQALFEALEQVGSDNAQGEFYLTDVLEDLPWRRARRACASRKRRLRVPRRELARPAGRGDVRPAVAHQQGAHGGGRHHVGPDLGVDRPRRGNRARC